MKVLMVNNLYAPNVRGGAERSVQFLSEALVRGGVEVTVVNADERIRPPTNLNGVKVVTLALPSGHWPFGEADLSAARRKLWHLADIYNPRTKKALVRVLREEKPDVVHTNNLQGVSVSTWWAAEAAGVPVLHTLRDYYLECARATCFHNGRNCTRSCLSCLPFCAARRILSQRVAGVVGTSRFILAHHLEKGFFRGASLRCSIPNPRADPVVPRKRTPTALLTFGYLGRLQPLKGVELLLRSFETRKDSRWRLLIAGTGPPAVVQGWQRRAERAERPEQIRFLGWTDAADFLARIDVLLVPSLWHEPLSRSVIEAHANGVPVVASRRGGLSELVEEGENGLLFEPDEAGSLARAIDELLQDPQRVSRLSTGALESSHRFQPEVIAQQYVEAYRHLKSSRFQVQGSRSGNADLEH